MNSTKIKHVHFIAIIGQPNSGKSSLVGDISQQKTDVSPEANFNQHENFNFYQININPVVDAVSKTYLVDVGGLKFKRASNDLERAEQLLTYLINFPTKIEDSFAKTFQIENIDQCTYAYVVLSSNGNISTETLTIINHLERNSAVWFYVNSRFDERMRNSDSENQKIKGTHMKDIYESFSNYRVEFLNQRCFFISIKEEERNKEYNDLAKLKVALNKSIHEVITFTDSISSSANINITITGAGNIGKSSLVNFLIGKNAKVYATVGEGQQTSKTKPYDLPECPIIKIIDNPGHDGNFKLLNFATNFELIILMLNQTVTAADNSLIDQWRLMNKFGCDSRLFVVKSFFDKYEKTDGRTLDQIKDDIKQVFYEELGIEDKEEIPLYCVSFKEEHRNEPWNSDLIKLLGDSMQQSDWFNRGLSERSRNYCLECISPIDNERIKEIEKEIKKFWEIFFLTGGSCLLSILPIAGDLFENKMLRRLIHQNATKLHLRGALFERRIELLNDILTNKEQRDKLEKIKKRYSEIEETCELFIREALEEEASKHSILNVSVAFNDIRNGISRALERFIPRLAADNITSATISAAQVAISVSDDVARVLPSVSTSILNGVGIFVGAGIGASFSGFAGVYMYFISKGLTEMLIEDAKFVYLLD